MWKFLKSLFQRPEPITYYELDIHIARTLEAVIDDSETQIIVEKLDRVRLDKPV